MDSPVVIRGMFCNKAFVPAEPLPEAEGPAELIVHVQAPQDTRPSIYEAFGKAEHLRTAEDLDAQLAEERGGLGRAMIYADSGIIMRWVEGTSEVRDPIEARWQRVPAADRVFITSRMARLECRCRPLRDRRGDLLRLYDVFFAGKELVVREIDAAVVERATELRADVGLKTPDAIHAATAMLAGAASFWTTDARLARCPGLVIQVFKAV